MRVIVTRVQPQAARWVQQLAPRFGAVALPLIETSALADKSAVLAAWQRWPEYAAVMFVSAHAVNFFFKEKPASTHISQASPAIDTRAWATGPGTLAALLEQGVSPGLIDSPPLEGGQFDSEALWQQVHGQITPGARVLIVRGDTRAEDDAPVSDPSAGGVAGVGRDWLAQRLHKSGAAVDFVVAYRRGAPVWTPGELALAATAASDGSVWVFSSAEAVDNLHQLMPGQSWAKARAVATHARIAQAVRQLGFAVVLETRPTLKDVVVSIESMA
jgi:uroporphyrinogen-III synthase